MLKFLVFLLLIAAVIAFFALRHTPRRPPRDWGRGGDDDDGPVPPAGQIGEDKDSAPAEDLREPSDTKQDGR